jgi:CMP-N-acetylneuraminic acid synthetase
MSTRSLVALLPMKGHSERIPNKNFRPFLEKPLFRWIFDKLVDMDEVNLIVINTDVPDELRELTIEHPHKVLIRQRRPEISGDFVSMNRVIEDDIDAVAAEVYLMTHATNPLLGEQTIRSALTVFSADRTTGIHDSLFSVNAYQTRFYDKLGGAINHDPNNLVRTQDLEPWFEENSNLYLFTRQSFQETHARIGRSPRLFKTPRLESIDIDDMDGWVMAEAIADYLARGKAPP